MDKREVILNAMRELFKEGKAGTASVSDIAKKAGIAKGGLYYYFNSKEAVMDALIEQEYAHIIKECDKLLSENNENAIEKFALLFRSYHSFYVDPSLDEYLHMPQNAALHQKSLVQIFSSLSPLISNIIDQGVNEGIFTCKYPKEYAEIIMSTFCFLFDHGIFPWNQKEYFSKINALADILEKSLNAPEGSFQFLCQGI